MQRMKFTAVTTACLTMLLTSGCSSTPPVATDTEAALCGVLRPALPKFSDEDTRETQEGVARFYDLFTAPEVCGD